MSDILTTANLYNKGNTFRSDTAGSTKGNARKDDGSIGFDCSGLVYHVLRESGYNVPYAPSSVMSGPENFTGSWATPVKESAVSSGTLVYFNGHVGIVNSYNPETKTGTFLSMTGQNNVGSIKPEEPFTTDDKNTNPNITWGKTTAFKGFATVNQDLYDPQLDQHANGANANTPVFNIPEHKTSGFITLPQNGGFPTIKEAKDLSSLEKILIANQGVAPLPGHEAAVGTTPFAKTLANLESKGVPNDGYTAQAFDHDAKGNVLPGIGAIGRYGFRAGSLKAIGWMDDKGEWTDAAKAQGVDSLDSFKDNSVAQEDARVAYIQVLKGELRNNGSWDMIGETVEDHVVTEGGLIAAAWKEGSGAVLRYFNGQSTNINADNNIAFRFDRFSDTPIGTSSGAAAQRNSTVVGAAPTGHWESTTQYDEQGNVISSNGRIWIPDAPAATSTSSATPRPAEPTNHTTTGRTYLSRDGASATLPDGTVVNAGAGGHLALDDNGNLVATRPSSGYDTSEGVVDVIRYSKTGQVIGRGQEQVIVDPLHPDAPEYNTKVVQGQEREITVTNSDGSTSKIPTIFQVGVGWVESGTGEVVQDIATWRAQPNNQATPTSLNQLIDAFGKPTVYSKDQDIQLASSDPGFIPNQPAATTEPAQAATKNIASESATDAPTPSTQPFVQYGSDNTAALQPYSLVLNLLNSLDGAHFSKLSPQDQAIALASLYSQADSLGQGNNLWGGGGEISSSLGYLSLAQSVKDGNALGTLSGINSVSGGYIDASLNTALGSTGAATLQRELHAGQGGHAAVGNQAFALEGDASESADFQSQSFGALVVHEQAVAQTIAQVTTLQVLRDAENDGFLEPTEWVAAADDLGHTQGLLVVDFNRNGQIETRDILNLGGNSAEPDNHSTEATQANSNADLQRNNVQWLDAHDPAFAAIRLWVDVNQDGRLDAQEGQILQSLHISAIDIGNALDAVCDNYRYTFDSCLRAWNMSKRPVLFTSANSAEWRSAA